MERIFLLFSLILSIQVGAAPRFIPTEPLATDHYNINTPALCKTAKETLAYLNKGSLYDPAVIHAGRAYKVPLARIKASLIFICQHQQQMNDPLFVKEHFDFIRWYPDIAQTASLRASKPLVAHMPNDKILMTKYYVHSAKAAKKPTAPCPVPLYALPKEEELLSLEEAEEKPNLIRHRYGKQAILNGALTNKNVPVLAYLNRDDLEAALMQGTIIANFVNHTSKIFNVHRTNNVPYNKAQHPYKQERYWYFKEVDGIKGYGKDADHKITVNSEVTFAADLEQLGLGKLLMVQYPMQGKKIVTRVGILADTGGAFKDNLYQVDFLAGTYASKDAFYQASRRLPDYVTAYFMVLKEPKF